LHRSMSEHSQYSIPTSAICGWGKVAPCNRPRVVPYVACPRAIQRPGPFNKSSS
jgi:hypothetical protein